MQRKAKANRTDHKQNTKQIMLLSTDNSFTDKVDQSSIFASLGFGLGLRERMRLAPDVIPIPEC
jgi:hypothetical protein